MSEYHGDEDLTHESCSKCDGPVEIGKSCEWCMRQASKQMLEASDPDLALRLRVGRTITYLSKHNAFDKQRLIQLLKDCRDTLAKQDDGFMRKRQAD